MKSILDKIKQVCFDGLVEIKEWILIHQSDVILVIGVILISQLSFAMGYIFAKQQDKPPIKFEVISEERK